MVDGPGCCLGGGPFIAERLPLSDLAWIEVPATLEALLRDQAHANGIRLIRGQAVELRCVTPQYGDAIFMIYRPHDVDRLHMLALKVFQKGRA